MNKLFSEGVRYLMVGVLTTVINILTYRAMLWTFNYFVSTTVAFILAVAFAFWANKYLVFRSGGREGIVREFLLFLGSRISTFIIETLGLVLLISGMGRDEMLAKVIMSVIVIILNYILSKFFIFKPQGNLEREGAEK